MVYRYAIVFIAYPLLSDGWRQELAMLMMMRLLYEVAEYCRDVGVLKIICFSEWALSGAASSCQPSSRLRSDLKGGRGDEM